jgi:hypothetical protein
MSWFTKPISVAEPEPETTPRENPELVRYRQVLVELEACQNELHEAAVACSIDLCTHPSPVSIVNGAFYTRVNVLQSTPEARNRLAARRDELLRRHRNLLQEFSILKRAVGLATY